MLYRWKISRLVRPFSPSTRRDGCTWATDVKTRSSDPFSPLSPGSQRVPLTMTGNSFPSTYWLVSSRASWHTTSNTGNPETPQNGQHSYEIVFCFWKWIDRFFTCRSFSLGFFNGQFRDIWNQRLTKWDMEDSAPPAEAPIPTRTDHSSMNLNGGSTGEVQWCMYRIRIIGQFSNPNDANRMTLTFRFDTYPTARRKFLFGIELRLM